MYSNIVEKLAVTPRDPNDLPGLKLDRKAMTLPIIIIMTVIVTMASIVIFIHMANPMAQLTGKNTSNAIASIYEVEKLSGNRSCVQVSYKFKDKKGMEFTGKSRISSSSPYCKLKESDTITIRYANGAPDNNYVDSEIGKRTPDKLMVFIMMPLMILLVLLPLLLPQVRQKFQAKKIFKNGVFTKAKVYYIKRDIDINRGAFSPQKFKVFLDFTDADGKQVRTGVNFTNDWLVNQLAVGSELHVIYLAEKPEKAMIVEDYIC
ncbi:MAG: hypothetical protein D6B27_01330 [Gammaproteobacteria bacterium]|nr:MAG: hypothetical protein D6B27_01330 [Gammaproteobacteria bacterium]